MSSAAAAFTFDDLVAGEAVAADERAERMRTRAETVERMTRGGDTRVGQRKKESLARTLIEGAGASVG